MNKTILVTGADGQVGNELRQLAGKYPQYNFLFTNRNLLDITDRSQVDDYFNKNRIDIVINCAAYTAVDRAESEKEKAFSVNADAVLNLAVNCTTFQIPFLHVSSDFIFDGKKRTPYTESDTPNPLGVYAESKRKGEELALAANPKTIVVRTSWVYSSFGHNFVKTMLRLGKEKPELRVVNDQTGSPTYALDLAKALLTIAGKVDSVNQFGIFNYSNHGNITWYDFAKSILELKEINTPVIPIPTTEFPTPAKRPSYSVLDLSKIRLVYGVTVKDWKESLTECLQKL